MRVLIITLLVILSGCAGILNPYSSEFTCPQKEKGKCAPVKEVYDESKQSPLTGEEKEVTERVCGYRENCDMAFESCWDCIEITKKVVTGKKEAPSDEYTAMKHRILAGLMKTPPVPMVLPPKVLRIAVFPYVDNENDLYTMRYIYIFADSPSWVIESVREVGE